MIVNAGKKLLTSLLVFALIFTAVPVTAFAAEAAASLLDGKLAVTYDSDTTSVSDGTVTATAAPVVTSGMFGDSYDATSEELTLTNTSGSQAVVKFSYSALDNVESLTINGTAYQGSDTWTGVVENGGTVNIVLTCGDFEGNAELTIGDFEVTDNGTKTITFKSASNGSITVNGGSASSVSTTYATGTAVTAAAASGYEFLAWVDGNGNILSTDASTTIHPTESCTVEAVFVSQSSSQPYFEAAGRMFTDLNEAASYAASSGVGTVIPMRDATVPAGDYTIPEGVTLLVPFNDSEEGYKAVPHYAGTDYTTPTVYRELTLADGATVTVNGELCVSAKHASGTGTTKSGASPTGACGFMVLEEGSNLIITDGAKAYVWGFIIGNGNMTAKSGASVYENMQVADFRGGTKTLQTITKGTKAFPFSQYYIQNVEAPLTLESGAAEYAYLTLTADMESYGVGTVTSSAAVQFIGGSGSMFALGEGTTVTKTYLPDEDRLQLEINGEFSLNSLTINAMGQSINSATFNLPINNNISIIINSGTATINQDVALQPGVEVTVAEGAEVKVASGSSLYVYDSSDWGAYVHMGTQFRDVIYSPTKTYTRTASDIKDVVLDINGKLTVDGEIYTTSGGANITSSNGGGIVAMNVAAGSETSTQQLLDDATISEIAITPMKLKNADGSYIATASAAAGDAYVYDDGSWKAVEDVTITFDVNGGEGSLDSQTIKKETIVAGIKTKLSDISSGSGIKKTGYTFGGWNTEADGSGKSYTNAESVKIFRDTTLYAQWTPRTYTVTFLDGTTKVAQFSQAYETTVEAPEDPVKEGYTFAGWSIKGTEEIVEFPVVMPAKALTYSANWTVNQYTLTFDVNGGDTEIASITQDYGTALDVADPTREGYTFAGWTPALPETVPAADTTYTANWTINEYTITFNTAGGSAVDQMTVKYGEEVTAPADPTREGYTFAGWDVELPETMPAQNLTLTAQWTINEYTIDFDSNGGSEVDSITQNYGTAITAPADPTREGYTFKGWTVDGVNTEVPSKMPAKNMTLKAEWEINQYTITFNSNGGSEVAAITQDYGSAVTAPADPTREGYTFAGWDTTVPANMPAKNMTITAKWTINQYTISFDVNGGDSEIDAITQNYDTVISQPADPVREGYTFTGWTPAVPSKMPAENMTLTAQWAINQYTLTFDTDGGTEIDSITADYGTEITAPADPEKTGYTFQGWDVEMPETMPGKDLTLTAQWKINQYTITFDTDGGSEVAAITQDYDSNITAPAEPTKAGYTFAGWSLDGVNEYHLTTMPAEDITLIALWRTEKPVTVYFEDYHGDELYSSEEVAGYWGALLTAPADPVREGYTFTGWDPEVPERFPENDTTYFAEWEINQYTITFDSNGGSEVEPITQDYGSAVTAPATPVREGYTFAGWSTEVPANMPAENLTLTAQWTINQYTITLVDGIGNVIDTITYEYGSEVAALADPAREGYTFTGWDVEIPETMPAENITVTAQWSVNQYTITFESNGGSEVAAITQDYGSAVTAPADPVKEGYTFAGWDMEVPETMPAEDLTLSAQWDINQYTITYVDGNGNVINAATYDYGSEVAAPGEPAREGYTFAGWDVEIPETMPAENITVTAQWTVNQYTITFNSNGGSEVAAITQDYGSAVTAPAAPTKTNYEFTGWTPAVPSTMPAENVTLIAQWRYNYTGWNEAGTSYYEDGTAVTGVATVPAKDGSGNATYIFNANGVLTSTTGLYTSGNDTYLAEKGVVVENAGLVLIDGSYYYFGTDNKAAKGQAEVTKTNDLLPAGTYTFDDAGKMVNPPQSIAGKTVTLGSTSFVYDGNAKTPAVTVAGLSTSDYEVSYANNVNPGTATVTVTGKNGYFGTLEAEFTIVLGAPEIDAAINADTGKITLGWDAVKGADKYEVYRSTSKSSGFVKVTETASTSWTDTSAVAGTTYYYKAVAVYSKNTAVNSAYGNTVQITCDLAAPTGLTASNVTSSGKIKLTWDKVDGADQYEVYRATSKSGTYTKVTTTSKTTYTNTSATAGKTYYYKVVAVCSANTDGNSAASAVISKVCKLARPEVTTSNVESTGKVKLTWKKIDGADKYKVYRATSENGTYTLLTTTTKVTYTNTSATAGKNYYYKVMAVDADKSSANSAYSAVKKATCKLARPDVTASNVASTGKIKLSWKKVAGAEKYEVYRATSKNGTYKKLTTTTKLSYTNTSATAGKTYYYKVKAVDNGNSSAKSAYSTVDSKVCKLARPNVTAKSSTKKQIKLTWSKVSGAKKYEVYRATSKNGTYKKVATVTGTSYTNKSLKSGKTYYYKVKAVASKSAANSAYSSIDKCKCK